MKSFYFPWGEIKVECSNKQNRCDHFEGCRHTEAWGRGVALYRWCCGPIRAAVTKVIVRYALGNNEALGATPLVLHCYKYPGLICEKTSLVRHSVNPYCSALSTNLSNLLYCLCVALVTCAENSMKMEVGLHEQANCHGLLHILQVDVIVYTFCMLTWLSTHFACWREQ